MNLNISDEIDMDQIWKNEQEKLSTKCLIIDTEEWQIIFNHEIHADCNISKYKLDEFNTEQIHFELVKQKAIDSLDYEKKYSSKNECDLKFIAGLDISYIKGIENEACVAVVIFDFPQLNVIYEDISMVKLSSIYMAGFLSYREAPGLIEGLQRVLLLRPDLRPQLILVDGNGILHHRKFGLACQIGLHFDTPCIGVAKNLFHVDGLENNINHKKQINCLKKSGDYFPLIGNSKTLYGYALRSTDISCNPIYISPGHKISAELSLYLVSKFCKFRIPEPIRQADIRSRDYLRKKGYIKIENKQKENSKNKWKDRILNKNNFKKDKIKNNNLCISSNLLNSKLTNNLKLISDPITLNASLDDDCNLDLSNFFI